MAPVGALGIFAPIGILFAFFYSMTLLPALIMILPTPRTVQTEEDTLSGRVLVRLGNASINKPWRVIISTVFIAALAIYYSLDIQFTHDPMKWFPEDNSLRVDTAIIDDAMAGSMSLEILIDKGEDYAFHDPTNLKGLEQISEAAEGLSDTVIKAGQSFSLVEVLKEIHKGLNGNQAANYELASERKLISQELLLFENSGSDDLEELVDTVYSKARMTLIVNWDDALHYVTFVDRVKQIALEHFSADEIAITGLMPILSSTFKMVYQSMVNSYAMALIIIIPLVMLIVGSIKIGSLTMAPNLLPILLCLGVMGFMNLPVDAFTMLVGGVSIGLVVDDSIHFLHHFKLFFDQSRSVEKAVSDTLRTTGRALMFTTIVLVCGFCAFAMSSMENLVRFGLLTSMTISLALLADVLLLPAIISLVYSEYKSNNTLKESVAG